MGSIAHHAAEGDVVNGVGCKHPDVPPPPVVNPPLIRGVRGPKTLEALRNAGHDTSTVEFMGDPGLLIGRLFPQLLDILPETNREIFIPHFRERSQFGAVVGTAPVVDIDATPLSVATEIARAEVVHTSSLHGLIWAHALGRDALLVQPRTAESAFKYEDYFASVNAPFSWAEDVASSLSTRHRPPRIEVDAVIKSITMPIWHDLTGARIATAS